MAPQIINYLICIVLLSLATAVMVRKRKQEPDLKLFGFPVAGIITLNLFVIMLMIVMLVFTLVGNPMQR
jgi:NADH:ubiquinone oxidoreductase subunit 6 (subunit J)